ncbi:ABC transporter permease [Cutibacterium sp. WCA-380-WT-3A]|uniref:ABC transporter permease n=1 Tax=Cutibacterium porci TaxID=2605781 RepID=A0A7K0J8Q7_9ACTN|nr:ABC transporter permease [Cutibacterium porci]MSS46320.1 ABC transporter permease [Cutibacterium porci]
MPRSPHDMRPLRGFRCVAFPFTPWYVVLVTVGGAMCSLVALRGRWAWGVWQVQDVVVTLRESSMLWAIVAGLMGASLAERMAPSDMVVGVAPARSILGIHWCWFWRQTVALLTGTVIVAAPLVVKAWLNATPTVAEASDLIVILLSFAALVAVAHLVAAMVCHPIVWVLAPLVCIVVVGLPVLMNGHILANTGYSSVALGWSLGMSEPGGTHTVTPEAVVVRALFFLIVTISCILASARWSQVRSGGLTWRRVMPCVALIAPPLIIAAVGVVMPVPLFRNAPLAFECSSHEGVRVCVTPAHRSLAASYAKPAQRVASVMPHAMASRDILLAEAGYHVHGQQLVIDLGEPTSYRSAQQLSDLTGEGLAQSFSGRDACAFMSTSGDMTSQQMEALGAVDTVERTILRLAGLPHDEPTSSQRNSLDGMDVTAFRHWYTAHHRAVSTCSLTSRDLHR